MRPLVSLLFHDVYAVDPAESGFDGVIAHRYKLARREFAAIVGAIAAPAPCVSRVSCAADLPRAAGVLLTVDDGGASFAREMADVFEARAWRGHAFISTRAIGARGFLTAAELRDLDRRGHVIGSHSATHPARFSACDERTMRAEWRESRQTLEDVLGHAVRVASLPGGYLSRRVVETASSEGFEVLFTSEPVRRPWIVDGCTALGRFTVLPGQSEAQIAALAAGARLPLTRQWTAWTAKKALKSVLGPAYARVGAWVLMRRA